MRAVSRVGHNRLWVWEDPSGNRLGEWEFDWMDRWQKAARGGGEVGTLEA